MLHDNVYHPVDWATDRSCPLSTAFMNIWNAGKNRPVPIPRANMDAATEPMPLNRGVIKLVTKKTRQPRLASIGAFL